MTANHQQAPTPAIARPRRIYQKKKVQRSRCESFEIVAYILGYNCLFSTTSFGAEELISSLPARSPKHHHISDPHVRKVSPSDLHITSLKACRTGSRRTSCRHILNAEDKMSSSSSPLPPDLRVLSRKLTSIPPAQLPHSLPSLVNHVLRCREPLSAPQDQKLKDNAPESALLVHKLKTSITTLLNGRSREARFAAIGLVKAVVDVGGWEVLRGSEPWVRGLLSIVQVCVRIIHLVARAC